MTNAWQRVGDAANETVHGTIASARERIGALVFYVFHFLFFVSCADRWDFFRTALVGVSASAQTTSLRSTNTQ